MCLVTIAWQQSAALPLVIAANRDESFSRPSDDMGWWVQPPDIIGGRDLEAGGTWLAMHKNGRFGIVTNYREIPGSGTAPRSRGELIVDWLTSDSDPESFADTLLAQGAQYAGFNLLYGDNNTLAYASNRSDKARLLAPGIYALSNGLLDSQWPKVTHARQAMRSAINHDNVSATQLKQFLTDTTQAADEALPDEDFAIEQRRLLSAPFILGDHYGTRCSTIVRRNAKNIVSLHEQQYAAGGVATRSIDIEFQITELAKAATHAAT